MAVTGVRHGELGMGSQVSEARQGSARRITARFARVCSEQRAAYVQYICAGDPDFASSLALLKSLPAAGVDLIELGMPFSDPMADGPVIQRAAQRALAGGHTMQRTLEMVRAFREHDSDTPLVLMGYSNSVYVRGYASFTQEAAQAGVDGILLVDMPAEEGGELRYAAERSGIAVISLVSPVTSAHRMQLICSVATGFVYYVSITGVTGTAAPDLAEVSQQVSSLREHSGLPVAIGFGVNTPQQVRQIGEIGDGVVVGSVVIKALEEVLSTAAVSDEDRASQHRRAVEYALKTVRALADGVKNNSKPSKIENNKH